MYGGGRMWGDPQGAADLDPSHPLSVLLFRVSGPAPVPPDDPTLWRDLLGHYDVLVHVDPLHNSVVDAACTAMGRNAGRSGNLAALTVHVARMVGELSADAAAASASASDADEGRHAGSSDGRAGAGAGAGDVATRGRRGRQHHRHQRRRVALEGRARATSGALNLLRVLAHSTVASACRGRPRGRGDGGRGDYAADDDDADLISGGGVPPPPARTVDDDGNYSASSPSMAMERAFTYREGGRRRSTAGHVPPPPGSATSNGGGGRVGGDGGGGRDAAGELLSAIVPFLSVQGGDGGGVRHELYDCTVLALSLLLVLLSTQLYQPMVSSAQGREDEMDEYRQQHGEGAGTHDEAAAPQNGNFFLDKLMEEARNQWRRRNNNAGAGGTIPIQRHVGLDGLGHPQHQPPPPPPTVSAGGGGGGGGNPNPGPGMDDVDWAHGLTNAALRWMVRRPRPPPRSIAAHHSELVRTLVESRGERPGPDGMYENHAVVLSDSPSAIAAAASAASNGDGGGGSVTGTGGGTDLIASGGGVGGIVARFAPLKILSSTKAGIIVQAAVGVLTAPFLIPFRLVRLAVSTIGLFGHHSGGGGGGGLRDEIDTLHSVSTNDVIWMSTSPLADLSSCLLLLLSHNFRATVPPTFGEGDGYDYDDGVALAPSSSAPDGHGDGDDGSVPTNAFLAELSSLEDNRWENAGDKEGGEEEAPTVVRVENGDGVEEPGEGDLHGRLLATNGGGTGYERGSLVGEGDGASYAMPPGPPAVRSTPFAPPPPPPPPPPVPSPRHLSMNFESIFEALGVTVHTELGALLLYTLLQSCPSFAAAISARSDLDTLVMPLLRTLYFSSRGHVVQPPPSQQTNADGSSSSSVSAVAAAPILYRPFRSQSQLYVILILLLLFSQDSSFGSDAFRRVTIPSVPWYRERVLRDISLGSVLVLVLLRCMTFNLNRLRDGFLLSNCCAVLLNLAPHVRDLHSYSSMRLASVTTSCMKKFVTLASLHAGAGRDDEEVATSLGMYGEASRALLQVVQQSLRQEVVGKNLHLLYALIYLQGDLLGAASRADLFTERELGCVPTVIVQADALIRKDGEAALTAVQAMSVLRRELRNVRVPPRPRYDESASSSDGDLANDGLYDADFSFTYEEESDPEVFFVPYVWEVAVCVVTASLLEWNKSAIRVFPLLDSSYASGGGGGGGVGVDDDVASSSSHLVDAASFSKDVSEVV